MNQTFQGMRILVTGASRGIGASLATLAARSGARIALAARSGDRLHALAQELAGATGAEVLPLAADITRDEDRRMLVRQVTDRFDGLDVLVNNAGVGSFGHFSTGSEEVLRQVMEVNFFAPAELTRLFIPTLTEAARAGRKPAVVNVSSMCGRRGVPAWSEYSASKFALCGLTDALRGELARFDIDVLLILPGLTKTGLSENLLHNTGRMKIEFDKGQPPEKVAQAILDSLHGRRREVVVGWEAKWILRLNRWLPRLVDRLMARRVRKLYQQEAATS